MSPNIFDVTKENDEYVVKYSTSPSDKQITYDVCNNNPEFTNLVVEFTPSVTMKIGYVVNGEMNWNAGYGHKEYVGGQKYKEVIDYSGVSLPAYFNVSFYLDCSQTVEQEKTLTIH